jgi:hypothetical protein
VYYLLNQKNHGRAAGSTEAAKAGDDAGEAGAKALIETDKVKKKTEKQ